MSQHFKHLVTKHRVMELEVLESKKGSKVVTASNLHSVLALPVRQYGPRVRKWLKDIYELNDGLRRPQMYRDFARRPRPGEPIEDFYITLELAKQIAMRSTSKHKLKCIRLLDLYANNGQLSLFQQAMPPMTVNAGRASVGA